MPNKRTPINKRNKAQQDLAAEQTETRIVINQAQEIGSSGLRETIGFVQEAYHPNLYYPQAYVTYDRLRRSMPEMQMIRRAFSAWSRTVEPIVDLPEDPTDDDKRYQDFILSDFENMDGGFSQFIETAINHPPFFGFGWWDVVPALRDPAWVPPPYKDYQGRSWDDDWRSEQDDGLIGLRRLAWRDLKTFNGWQFDGRKKVIGMIQHDNPAPPVTLPKDHGLHLTFGDPNSPEGSTPLEAVWRAERIKYGFEVIAGIGFEHAAGHLKLKKTEKGTLSTNDQTIMRNAARAVLTAQEGNYLQLPFGVDGEVVDVNFAASGNLLEFIKYYSILSLSIYMMQFIALNTMTNTGALASQVDSTQAGLFAFNGMLDGFASQYDRQVGRRLYDWNVVKMNNFTDLSGRPNIRFKHVENTVAMREVAGFLQSLKGIVPLGEEDQKAIRQRSGWMPPNNPAPEDVVIPAGAQAQPQTPPQNNGQAPGEPMNPEQMTPEQAQQMTPDQQASETKAIINQALRIKSRRSR